MSFRLYRLGGIEKRLCFYSCLRYDQRMPEPRQSGNFGFVANDEGMIGSVAFNADHFGMIRAADDDDVAVLVGGTGRELLNPSDKRAGGVDDLCCFFFERFLHLRRHAVCPDYGCFTASYLYRIADR